MTKMMENADPKICQSQGLHQLPLPQRGPDTGAVLVPLIAGQNSSLGNLSLAATFVSELDCQWRERFRQLCEYKQQFGDNFISRDYSINPELGKWVDRQCYSYELYQEGQQDYMTAERFQALESIGFVWETDAAVWSEGFRELCKYKIQHGHCRVPHKYPQLGPWVRSQRCSYAVYGKGKSSNGITAERIRALESIGFVWHRNNKALDANERSWREKLQMLSEFIGQFGHCNVPRKHKLGQWAAYQQYCRRLYTEGKQTFISAERIKDLEGAGIVWRTNATLWNDRFQQLREYRGQHGHCLVPIRYSANPALAEWARRHRHLYKLHREGKKSTLRAERIQALESIGFAEIGKISE